MPSVSPPGGKGTSNLTDLCGQLWALAGSIGPDAAKAASAARKDRLLGAGLKPMNPAAEEFLSEVIVAMVLLLGNCSILVFGRPAHALQIG